MSWAHSILARNGLDKTGRVEGIVSTPYSEVRKITQGEAVYYLKKTPAPLFVEAETLNFLHEVDPTFAIPKLVDADKDNFCFLLKSCGEQTLRALFATQMDIDLLKRSISEYQRIQKSCIPHIPELLEMGVQDWRLSRLPDVYERFVSDDVSLTKWGIDSDIRKKLRTLKGAFAGLCREIAAYNIPDTLNHSDFQENNMVIDSATGAVSIIDWGEVSISPALWSAVGCFKKTCWRYKITPDHSAYQTLRQHVMAGWGIAEKDIDPVFKSISTLDWIYYALSLAELEKNTGHFSEVWAERIKRALASFAESATAIGK